MNNIETSISDTETVWNDYSATQDKALPAFLYNGAALIVVAVDNYTKKHD